MSATARDARAARRGVSVGLVALGASLPGCAWGLRGGPEVLAGSTGSALVQGSVTGMAGFGSTHRDGTVSDGIVTTATLSAGGDAGRGGGALSLAGGMAWFSYAEMRRVGWTAGAEIGFRTRGGDDAGTRMLVGLRGGPHIRLLTRERAGGYLVNLGIDLVVQGELPTRRDSDDGVYLGGLCLSVGFTHVNYFHL